MGDSIDLFMVRLVVREGMRRVTLNHDERVLAAHLMKRKGMTGPEVADILGVTQHLISRYWRTKPPIDLDKIDGAVAGRC